ncbi:hypothetical protein JF732_18930 [Mycobacterium intracellulare]|uniref:Uncharacterized protein n=1 Tax=Mycobacterium intracellulare TaxID=1767 RepID=A0AAE4UE56_MYCIT|nr:hypothetical protein [Mycobacterium intracellulare]MCA2320687.1 hypothetical protein [Mycobacterium intracellulare]MCA2342617.1 hypothetical protein [Mycobacterium intracellulare]MDV6978203.1 hypothetical protein [Mycobacterium intracellulare]MDV6983596.1 hypothetical protein [Mycobacterium intracellulare]MDV7013709.1 hypothetical protein [Mycobacterium intracellulare]
MATKITVIAARAISFSLAGQRGVRVFTTAPLLMPDPCGDPSLTCATAAVAIVQSATARPAVGHNGSVAGEDLKACHVFNDKK